MEKTCTKNSIEKNILLPSGNDKGNEIIP